jgi:hypothetical protein
MDEVCSQCIWNVNVSSPGVRQKKTDKLTIDIDGWGRKETILLKMSRKQLTVQNVDKHK